MTEVFCQSRRNILFIRSLQKASYLDIHDRDIARPFVSSQLVLNTTRIVIMWYNVVTHVAIGWATYIIKATDETRESVHNSNSGSRLRVDSLITSRWHTARVHTIHIDRVYTIVKHHAHFSRAIQYLEQISLTFLNICLAQSACMYIWCNN